MSDILSAASLLVTIVSILLGLWNQDIMNALNTRIPLHAADKVGLHKQVKSILFTRVCPLAITSIAIAIIFMPDAVDIIKEAGALLRDLGLAGVKYSSTKTAIVFVVTYSLSLAIYISVQLMRTLSLSARLSK